VGGCGILDVEVSVMPQRVVTVTEVLDGQVALDIQCLDRIWGCLIFCVSG
jgi:hypothetical protein